MPIIIASLENMAKQPYRKEEEEEEEGWRGEMVLLSASAWTTTERWCRPIKSTC
jgi:hypothetical protein